jgi:hypothetical protein
MINNHFVLFQLPGNLFKNRKLSVVSYFFCFKPVNNTSLALSQLHTAIGDVCAVKTVENHVSMARLFQREESHSLDL